MHIIDSTGCTIWTLVAEGDTAIAIDSRLPTGAPAKGADPCIAIAERVGVGTTFSQVPLNRGGTTLGRDQNPGLETCSATIHRWNVRECFMLLLSFKSSNNVS